MLAPSERNVSWDTVAPDLEPDGALRDIYVIAATRADWQRLLDFVRARGRSVTYTVDTQPARLPTSVDDCFAARPESSPVLAFWFGPIHFAAHFFADDEIELDFYPNDVPGPAEFQSLVDFVRSLGDLLSKPVCVTPENCRDAPFLIYEPTTHEFRYVPPPFDRNA